MLKTTKNPCDCMDYGLIKHSKRLPLTRNVPG